MILDANISPEQDLLATVVQKANSINGIRQLNDDFKKARRETLNENGSDLKTGEKNSVSKEYLDVCLKYIPMIKAAQERNLREIA